MALIKKTVSAPPEEHRHSARDLSGLLEQLRSDKPDIRRWAALDLSEHSEAAEILCRCLEEEQNMAVRDALFTSLIRINNNAAVKGLIPLLKSEDAALRNGVIEALRQMPDALAPYMQDMLHDPDSDVRIFTVNVLESLCHPMTPEWLLGVIEEDTHINVCATAVDLLAEVGSPEMIASIDALPGRFANDPFLRFAADIAIRRIRGANPN
ncbi:HEAT repeat domain-containing protein [Thiorhodospira sibirica]|uniref:HEAT repeat domain-containing protein n=1 Tax=Thiorhodospira sibirica TaxID=154347 RepID=UPI00022C4061|nr:HEAT repeat domain-containing protein [Thiorhodospira sibirica]